MHTRDQHMEELRQVAIAAGGDTEELQDDYYDGTGTGSITTPLAPLPPDVRLRLLISALILIISLPSILLIIRLLSKHDLRRIYRTAFRDSSLCLQTSAPQRIHRSSL